MGASPLMSMMFGKILRRTVTILGLAAILVGLFGCNKAPKPARHSISEISSVSISCGHMDRSYGYCFWLRREEDVWLFDAECFIHDHEDEAMFEGREVKSEDVDVMLKIIEQNDSITYAENYKPPKKLPFEVMDETTYSFCLTFSDGSRYLTSDSQAELENFFYRLAEKYGNTETENKE